MMTARSTPAPRKADNKSNPCRRGRPVQVYLTDDHEAALWKLMQMWQCSASEAVRRLLVASVMTPKAVMTETTKAVMTDETTKAVMTKEPNVSPGVFHLIPGLVVAENPFAEEVVWIPVEGDPQTLSLLSSLGSLSKERESVDRSEVAQ